MLGIDESYEHFDPDIIIFINSSLSVLTQLGVGPEEGFSISDKTAVWSDFVDDETKFELIKSYIYLKVRLLFDPPANSTTANSFTSMISEFEWRLCVAADPESKEVVDDG